jgi:hypothetical protein
MDPPLDGSQTGRQAILVAVSLIVDQRTRHPRVGTFAVLGDDGAGLPLSTGDTRTLQDRADKLKGRK